MKLLHKLLLMTLLPLVISIGSILITNMEFSKRFSSDYIESTLKNELLINVNTLSNFFKAQISYLNTLSRSPIFRSGNLAQIHAYLAHEQAHNNNSLKKIYYTRTNGDVYDESHYVLNIKDRYFFKDLMNGQTIISKLIISRVTQRPVIGLLVPIKDQNGKVLGAVSAPVTVDSISHALNKIRVSKKGMAFLIDSSGHIIGPNFKTNNLEQQMRKILGNQNSQTYREHAQITEQLRQHDKGKIEFSVNQDHYWAYYNNLPTIEWKLLLAYHRDYILQDMIKMRNTNFFLLALSITIVIGLVVLFNHTLLSPIKHLILAHRQLGQGHAYARVQQKFFGELGELSQSFNIMAEQLEREKRERTQMEENLLLAKEKAEEANRAKGEFLAIVGHELRTPLQGVIGAAELIDASEVAIEVRDYVQTIKTCAQSLVSTINDILDISRINSGKLQIESKVFSLSELISDISEIFIVSAEREGLKLNFDIDHLVHDFLQGDPARIRQILINLMGNAIKFTPQGQVTLQVHLQEDTGSEQILCFNVIDTGIGIPTEKTPMIFQDFFQVDQPLRRNYSGTGLGLAICRRLVHLMNGEIGVESTFNQGSTFWFTLKLLKQARPHPLHRSTIPPQKFAPIPSGKNILIVDDNAVNRDILLKMLAHLGFKGLAVENGKEALEAIKKENFSLVLMDLMMPVMNGIAATRFIRGPLDLKDIPIIAISAKAGEKETCVKVGFNDFLDKPVLLVNLVGILEKYLSSENNLHVVNESVVVECSASSAVFVADS